jgi:hypothetical protein
MVWHVIDTLYWLHRSQCAATYVPRMVKNPELRLVRVKVIGTRGNECDAPQYMTNKSV